MLLWTERWRKREVRGSPLGSLEAAEMKLSAAVCNLCSYTVSDRWRGGGGGGGRQKYLAQFILGNCVAGGIVFCFF